MSFLLQYKENDKILLHFSFTIYSASNVKRKKLKPDVSSVNSCIVTFKFHSVLELLKLFIEIFWIPCIEDWRLWIQCIHMFLLLKEWLLKKLK